MFPFTRSSVTQGGVRAAAVTSLELNQDIKKREKKQKVHTEHDYRPQQDLLQEDGAAADGEGNNESRGFSGPPTPPPLSLTTLLIVSRHLLPLQSPRPHHLCHHPLPAAAAALFFGSHSPTMQLEWKPDKLQASPLLIASGQQADHKKQNGKWAPHGEGLDFILFIYFVLWSQTGLLSLCSREPVVISWFARVKHDYTVFSFAVFSSFSSEKEDISRIKIKIHSPLEVTGWKKGKGIKIQKDQSGKTARRRR